MRIEGKIEKKERNGTERAISGGLTVVILIMLWNPEEFAVIYLGYILELIVLTAISMNTKKSKQLLRTLGIKDRSGCINVEISCLILISTDLILNWRHKFEDPLPLVFTTLTVSTYLGCSRANSPYVFLIVHPTWQLALALCACSCVEILWVGVLGALLSCIGVHWKMTCKYYRLQEEQLIKRVREKEVILEQIEGVTQEAVAVFGERYEVLWMNRRAQEEPLGVTYSNLEQKLSQIRVKDQMETLNELLLAPSDGLLESIEDKLFVFEEEVIPDMDLELCKEVSELVEGKGRRGRGKGKGKGKSPPLNLRSISHSHSFPLQEVEIVRVRARRGEISQGGNTTRIIAVSIRQQAESKDEEYESYKNSLMCTLSHELRTPLNGIVGVLREVKSKGLQQDKGTLRLLNTSLSLCFLLKSKINDFLDYGQLISHDFQLHVLEIDIRKFAHKLIRKFRYLNHNKQVKISLNVQRKVPAKCVFDDDRLTQILANLLENALKYTQEGEITLEIGSHIKGIKFLVKDTGQGMSVDQLENLRSESSALSSKPYRESNCIRGSGLAGLGLTVTKLILTEIGARMLVRSTLNEGSTFYFILPKVRMGGGLLGRMTIGRASFDFAINEAPSNELPPPTPEFEGDIPLEGSIRAPNKFHSRGTGAGAEAGAHRRTQTLQAGMRGCSGERNKINFTFINSVSLDEIGEMSDMEEENLSEIIVLVVDDSGLNRLVLSSVIKKQGLFPLECANGLEALTLVQQLRANPNTTSLKILIFMDIEMPVMDGLEATAKILQLYKSITIYAVTAYASEEERKKCFAVGMKMFLKKPISVAQIKTAINLV